MTTPSIPQKLPESTTPRWQAGTWTLTAPDGRTWQADSPLKTVGAEQRDRIPAELALKRIFAACEESAQPQAVAVPAIPEGMAQLNDGFQHWPAVCDAAYERACQTSPKAATTLRSSMRSIIQAAIAAAPQAAGQQEDVPDVERLTADELHQVWSTITGGDPEGWPAAQRFAEAIYAAIPATDGKGGDA